MKKNLPVCSKTLFPKILVPLFFLFLFNSGAYSQVNFTQTSDADFIKGVSNSVLVSGGSVSLQLAAANPGLWWTGTTFLPQNLSGHKTITANNKFVYLVGGFNGSAYSNNVYVATIQTTGISAWTALNSLPNAVRDPAVVIGTNTIYVIGGRNATQIFDAIYYATINADGTIGTWQTSAVTLPTPLWGHSAVYLNGFIYVIGGSNLSLETSALNSVYFTKLKADNTPSTFSIGANLPAPRNMHSLVTYNNKMYLTGGYDNSGTKTNTVYLATPDVNGPTGSWTNETTLPVSLSNHSAVVSNGLIMVLGGATNTTLSNTIYYANLDQVSPLTWVTSSNSMFDFIKDGSAFSGNGQVIFTGGISQAGSILSNCRYSTFNMTSNYINHGVFVSYPFYELGAERLISSVTFNATYNSAFSNCQVSYRLAGNDKIWSDWSVLTSTSPIVVNQTKQYLQYCLFFTGQTTYNVTFNDLSFSTPGTTLSGNLNAITTFTAAASPYIVLSTISFTSGTHTFGPGTTVLFSPGTGMSVGQANIVCNGTETDSVTFSHLGIETGKWNGISFESNSGTNVSSQFFYTIIQNAGNSSYNSNLYCSSTTQPYLSHSCIRGADGDGIILYSSNPSFQNTIITGNTENGINLNSSNPTIAVCEISYNGGAGVYANTTASIFNGSTIHHNLYGVRYTSPNISVSQPMGTPTIIDNTYNGIAIGGGDITSSHKIWSYLPYNYFILGTVKIKQSSSNVRLTINAGNTLMMSPGTQIQVGDNSSYGGEFYANGTPDSLITFKPVNNLVGGWGGIYFNDYNDNYGGTSSMKYCKVEKGSNYNLNCESSTQPQMLHCEFTEAAGVGIQLSSSSPSMENCTIRNSGSHGITESYSSASIKHCQFLNNNGYPLKYNDWNCNSYLHGNTWIGNTINYIAISGGEYSDSRALHSDGIGYHVLGDIKIMKNTNNSRITIKPGVTLAFAPGKTIQVGYSSSNGYGGELYAQGTADSIITFKPFNDSIGGWAGIYFSYYNDNFGGTSSMKYCKVEKGASYNLYCESSNQPQLNNCEFSQSAGVGIQLSSSNPTLDSCTIRNSGSHGITESSSSASIQHCQFLNNNGYPLKYNDWNCNSYLHGNTWIGNTINYIAISGGDYSENRTLHSDGISYHVLGDIRIMKNNSNSRITVDPGVTLAFAPGKILQVGYSYYSSYGGELYAEGTVDSIITLKPFNDSIGGWGGIYFTNYNDNYGGTSSMKYCKVEKGASYNLYCESSNQPRLNNCEFSQSAAVGIQLSSSSPLIDSCTINNSGSIGIQLSSSNPTLSSCTISNSASHGIVESSSSASIQHCQFLNNNGYPIKYNDWSCNSNLIDNTYVGNNPNYIALSGGANTENRTLFNDGVPYHVLGTITNYKNQGHSKITIEPGVTLAFAPDTKIQIGNSNSGYGADLFAEGTADSIITFKPFNNTVGGWGGIYFADPDYFGGTSSMKYCKVEKGASYNLYCESSNQPQLNNCEFSQSAGVGIQLSSSNPTIDSCTIRNSGSHGITESASSASIQHCQFLNNNGYPLKYNDWSCDSYLDGNSWVGNTINYIAISGGDYSENRTLRNHGIGYHVLGNIRIMKNNSNSRITIEPGVTLAFAPGKILQVGYSNYYGGELYAIGTSDSIITFKPFNDSIGGWGGIYFNDYNDNYSGTSSMKYCKVEKGASYNLNCESSTQPQMLYCEFTQALGVGIQLSSSSPTIDSCTISNSGSNGMVLNSSNPTLNSCTISNSGSHGITQSYSSASIQHCQFLNNNGYPLKYNDWYCNSYLFENTWVGNSINYIALSGGDFSQNRTIYNAGIGYHVLGDIKIKKDYSNSRITIEPGVTLAFAPGKIIQIGYSYYYGGELYAEGNSDSIITFKPFNDSIGGWGGIYFNDYNDNYGGTSSMKYCKVEKAANNNILCEFSTQPLMDHCVLSQSTGNGLKLNYTSLTIRNSSFTHNMLNGILLEGSSNPTIGNTAAYSCNLYYNGGYNVYNNTSNTINARYNFWASRDSIAIKSHIFDKYDNAAKGYVYIRPFIDLPFLTTDSMAVNGTIQYANAALNAMKNARLKIVNVENVAVDSTATNTMGEYAFAPVQSGSYNLKITPVEPWGGINSTDALLILNHFAHISLLNGINLAAADVNASNTVNATDALFIMNRFVGNTNAFPSGNSFMEIDTVIVANSEVTNDLRMLWFGDVNASFEPLTSKSGSSVTLEQQGSIVVSSFTEFDLPVRLQTGNEIGAISLGFYYPEEFFEITGVEIGNSITNFSTSSNNGLTRLAWCDLNPAIFNDNDMIVNLKVRSLDLSGLTDSIVFGIYEGSELADKSGQELPGVILKIPGIQTLTVGIADTHNEFSLKVYPNPFKENTVIDFALVNESNVNIELYDLYGKQINPVTESLYAAGNHQVILNRENLLPGVYFLKIDFRNNDQTFSKMIKVVVSN